MASSTQRDLNPNYTWTNATAAPRLASEESSPHIARELFRLPSTVLAVWRESRPVVQFMFLLRFLSGAVLASGGSPDRRLLLGAAAWWLLLTAIYLRNGVADVVEDRGNNSGRPVAAGLLDPDTAAGVARGLAVIGLVLAARHGLALLGLGAAVIGLGWAYSAGPRPLKNSVGGFLVVVIGGGALTYLAGSVAGGGSRTGALLCFALEMSLWIGLAGWTKDLSDTDGDAAAGRRTLPVRLGYRRATVVMAVAALAVATTFLVVSVRLVTSLMPSAAITVAGAVVIAVLLSRSRDANLRPVRRRPYRVFMVTQYLAHLLVLVSTLQLAG